MKGFVVVDVGGTKISAAYFDGKLHAKQQIETKIFLNAYDAMQGIVALIQSVAQAGGINHVNGVGVACPGPLQPSRGLIINAPTLGWKNYPLRDELARHLGCSVLLENDANAAAYGEYRFGAGIGCDNMAYVTVSTGVGCGLILNGQIVRGAHEGAGELGHLHMQDDGELCVCGRKGCLEAYASGTGIAAIGGRTFSQPGEWDARRVAQMAREGNERCLAIYHDAGMYLGKAFALLQMLTDVGRIVIGGSVSAQLDLMMPEIQKNAIAYSYWGDNIHEWLTLASLGADAGLMGVGALVDEQIKKEK